MNEFIILSWLERVTGIEASSWVLFAGVVVAVCNIVTKRIPADSTGWMARVRAVTGFVGLVMSSRVTSQTSTMDVVKTMAEHGVGQGATPVVRGDGGKFVNPRVAEAMPEPQSRLKSPAVVTLVALVLSLMMLYGCATTGSSVCASARVAQPVVNETVRQCDMKGIY